MNACEKRRHWLKHYVKKNLKNLKQHIILSLLLKWQSLNHKYHNLNANEDFLVIIIFKLIACFIDGFPFKLKYWSIAYSLSESEDIY